MYFSKQIIGNRPTIKQSKIGNLENQIANDIALLFNANKEYQRVIKLDMKITCNIALTKILNIKDRLSKTRTKLKKQLAEDAEKSLRC